MKIVKVHRREGRIERVRPGSNPSIKLDLYDEQEVLSVEMERLWISSRDRKTDDWRYVAYVQEILETTSA